MASIHSVVFDYSYQYELMVFYAHAQIKRYRNTQMFIYAWVRIPTYISSSVAERANEQ